MSRFSVHEGKVSEYGGCMACSTRDADGKVYVIMMGNVQMRLCQQHIDELYERSNRKNASVEHAVAEHARGGSLGRRVARIEDYLRATGPSIGRPFPG